jgi:hypothetical protein
VITRKGGKVVTVPLVPRTARAIDLALGERCQGPIFLAADGRRLDRHGAVRIVRQVAPRSLAEAAELAQRLARHLGVESVRALRGVPTERLVAEQLVAGPPTGLPFIAVVEWAAADQAARRPTSKEPLPAFLSWPTPPGTTARLTLAPEQPICVSVAETVGRQAAKTVGRQAAKIDGSACAVGGSPRIRSSRFHHPANRRARMVIRCESWRF